jgi:hypothetical protein
MRRIRKSALRRPENLATKYAAGYAITSEISEAAATYHSVLSRIGPTKAEDPTTSCHALAKFVPVQRTGFHCASGLPKMSSWPPEMARIA